ncbi:MAG TPA: Fe-S cluster assembly ATPase SufC [Dictyoglomaceae bacterium]|nr:Fe-S cluster assembly ATPase SufC [Dictyoglomaceae bacterium]HOL39195.1 Fe-S cluster assembly ATPase SufC [Dictyoglomaceae bacterium]HPP15349.1 Fe-S cluster assembly ATPase SufC [Dictyoglomaceae bacterium]HPU43605.1 Fe-S cluster assembly ATPase SufC [Dictyoglomaceae bacterium]
MKEILSLQNLIVEINGETILDGLNLNLEEGIHVLLGPNGTGKSTLLGTLMGLSRFKVSGKIYFYEEDITDLTPDERFKKGIFLAYQLPPAVRGVKLRDILKKILNIDPKKNLPEEIYSYLKDLDLDESFLEREVNYGFSGGERKKSEVLQLLLAKPKLALLDEPDSGVDIDSLKLIGEALRKVSKESNLIVVTHNLKVLDYIDSNSVIVLLDGKYLWKGSLDLIHQIEEKGYEYIRRLAYAQNLS